MDDFQQLNSYIANEYEPEKLLIEAPDETIWDAIKRDNEEKEKTLREDKAVRKYEVSQEKYKSTPTTSVSVKTESKYSSGYGSYSNGYKSSYSYGTSYYSKKETAEELVEKDFRDIREQAFKLAEEATKNYDAPLRRKNNPQLEVLIKKKSGVKGKLKDMFGEGTIGRKGFLVAGMIAVKGLATMLYEMKQNMKNDK